MAQANPGNMPETGRATADRYRVMLAWVLVAVVIGLADQGTKSLLGSLLAPGEIRSVTGFFNLVLVFNRGAAFSLLADAPGWQRELFAGIALAAAGVIITLLLRNAGQRLFCAGLALILGGAFGNLWDRIALGHVVDFLDFHALGYHWPAFNLADSAITVGAALLILDGLRARKPQAD
jgi:signal peptidase II